MKKQCDHDGECYKKTHTGESIPFGYCKLNPSMENKEIKQEWGEIREKLADLEHEQWNAWSSSLASVEKLTPERLERWKKLWRPYLSLTEEEKDQDRKWADKVLFLLQQRETELREEIADFISREESNHQSFIPMGHSTRMDKIINKVRNGDILKK